MSINEKINDRFLQKQDKSHFKGKDLGLLNKVTDYLDSHGLQYEITGSAKENAEKGNPRNYEDIDIIVKPDTPYKFQALTDIARISAGLTPEREVSFADYVTSEVHRDITYCHVHVDTNFQIEDPSTSTKIDLNFEKEDPIKFFAPPFNGSKLHYAGKLESEQVGYKPLQTEDMLDKKLASAVPMGKDDLSNLLGGYIK